MSNSRSFARFGVLSHGVFAAFLMLCGCEKSESITTYSVPKHESLQTPKFLADHARRHQKPERPNPERMIAVVIPRDDMLWFFKLQGDVDKVAARERDVREFLTSVRFPERQKIDWTLPPTWRRLPASQFRYATLVIDGDPSLELSVTPLPMQEGIPITQQVVANVNRWRGQLSLSDDNELKDTERLTVDEAPAYWINIVGLPKPKPAGMFNPQRPAEQVERREEPKEPVFETPEGWIEGSARLATVAFKVMDGKESVLITVTSAAGDRLSNVNRWRGQLNLESFSQSELEASAKEVAVGPLPGELFEITNEGRTIFGVITQDHGRTWFIKLLGDAGLAERERSHFESFLKSLKWN